MSAPASIPAPRSAVVEHRTSYLRTPLPWVLLLSGPTVGGYGTLRDRESGKFADRADAELAGRIFVETGTIPAFQTDEQRLAASLRQAA